MERYNIQFIQSAIVIIGYLITYFVTKNYINSTLKNAQLQRARRKVIIKVIQFFTTLTLVVLLGAIWGLKQSEIAVFVSTILTALGIAFFAQWSLLSNITSSIIIFLNHPLRIGDYIKIIDKDAPIEGEIADLTYFFVHIKTNDGETITIPNTMFLQKTIMIINKQS